MLIAAGLQTGAAPEEWNLTRPDELRRIHASYLQAGSDVISTNTFGATAARLASHGLGDRLRDINTAGVRLAGDAVAGFREGKHGVGSRDSLRPAGEKCIALSIGPTGKLLPPVGPATEDEIRGEYLAQIESIDDDFDLVVVETIFDLREGVIALQTAKSLLPCPVAVSLTYEAKPRGFFTMMGNEAGDAVRELEAAGADIVGANCSISSADMLRLAALMRRSTDLPILCQPNAGNPALKNGLPVYEQRPQEFAGDAVRLLDMGINAVGGCCGTTPDFIRELSTRVNTS